MMRVRRVLGLPVHYLVMKRLLDVVLSGAALLVLSPLLLLVALLVRLDSPGPALYGSWRTGTGGRRFRMVKFRTMVPNADEVKEQYRHLSVLPWPDFKVIPDPRVTRVGRLLRKTSIDEIPQLWNVVKGDMSLVGPRPCTVAAENTKVWHNCRLDVRPGLTGPWQIYGRNTANFDERSRLDARYIRSMSLRTDLRLMVLTIPALLTQGGV